MTLIVTWTLAPMNKQTGILLPGFVTYANYNVRLVRVQQVKLENVAEDLQKNITTLKLTCEHVETLEEKASDMEADNEKLNKAIEKLRETVQRLQAVEQANINLNIENQALKRSLDNAKHVAARQVAAEEQKEECEHELQHLRRTLEGLREVQVCITAFVVTFTN